jgi:hypothetical protein
MTHTNHAQTAATHPAASLSRRLHRLLVVVVAALFGMTLTSVSFAASSPSPKGHATTKPHATTAAHRPSAQTTTAPKSNAKANSKSKTKPKTAVAQHPTQQRKTPTKARVAAKSKPATRAHQPASKPVKKLATKQTKHTA